jgi:WhiB family transcriptional regulator, redox-sensing transcriptional regulator
MDPALGHRLTGVIHTFHPQAEENPVPAKTHTRTQPAATAWHTERARRDLAVLTLAAHGHTRDDIATRLGLTIGETKEALRRAVAARGTLTTAGAVAIAHLRGELPTDPVPAPALTRRTRQVLLLIAAGRSNQQIAEDLFISHHSVKVHVARLLELFGVADRVQLVDRGFRSGVLAAVARTRPQQRPLCANDTKGTQMNQLIFPEPVPDASADWRKRAACRGSDPELFFPVGTGPTAAEQTEQAKRICEGCPVRSECLTHAFKVGADGGVWGGLSDRDRRALRRRASRSRADA